MRKKIKLLALFIIFYTLTHAQNADWMMGTWKSTSRTTTPSANVTNIIQINNVSGESFTGTKTSEINNGSHAKITISIAGFIRGKDLYLQNEEVVHKEPENAQWYNCSACTQVNKMIISRDSLILINSISGCDNRCNAETFYYRLLSEYDGSTQRYLVDWFGRPADIIGFRPFLPQENKAVASNGDNESSKTDSLNLAKQKEQQRIKDSLDNIARIRQQQIDDSAQLAQQKKRDQDINDSIILAKQKEQQRIKDSLDNISRIRQQQIDDSTQLAQRKKRQLQIADSLNLVQQKEQQRIKDSLDNVARIRQQQIDDSTLLAQQKKREHEIADSLNLVKQKEQQRINDSLQKAALAKAVPSTTDTNQSANKALTTRTNILLQTYHITSPDILIELFDNGEIDGDRVSVYHNNTLVVSNQVLGTKPITLNIHADATNREHEFVLVAENLGSIPPNSALMRITAGKQTYKLSVNTDMKTNARIVFYYDGN